MDSFDDKMRQLFDADPNVPDGYGWDENADEIYRKMGGKERRRVPIWWILGLGLLILGGLGVNALMTVNTAKHKNIVFEEESKSGLTKLKNDAQGVELQYGNIENAVAPSNREDMGDRYEIERSKKATIVAEKNKRVYKEQKTSEVISGPAIVNVIPSVSTQEVVYSGKEAIENIAKIEADQSDIMVVDTTLPNSSRVVSDLEKGASANENSRSISSMTFLLIRQNQLSEIEREWERTLSLVEIHPTEDIKMPSSWPPSILVGGGTLLGVGDYAGMPYRNEYSTWKPGYHFTSQVGLENENGWSISLAYNYDMAVQYFELINVDSVLSTQSDVVTTVTTSALTGLKTESRANISEYLDRVRNYQVYNTFKSHSLKLLAGKSFLLSDQWTSGLSAGGRYSLFRASRGHTTDFVEEVFAYEADTQELYKELSLDVVLGANVEFAILDNLSLTSYIHANKSISSWSKESGVTYNPTLVQLGVGLKYDL